MILTVTVLDPDSNIDDLGNDIGTLWTLDSNPRDNIDERISPQG